jgi:hypothetical protein
LKPSLRLATVIVALNCLFWLLGATLCGSAASPVPQEEDFYAIRAESDLVLVPTFVYDRTRVGYSATSAESACWDANALIFYKILLSRPYLPANCDPAGIAGLTAADFHIFEDGVEQSVRSVMRERWRITVRDNLAKYDEFSQSPRAIWSTADLARDFFPFDASFFYVLAYVPSGSQASNCHHLEVKVDHPEAWVLARPQYCQGQSQSDPLNQTSLGQRMERDLISGVQAKIDLSLQAGSFYSGGEKDRLDIALEFPWKSIHTEPVEQQFPWKPLRGQNVGNWSRHTVAVLAIAYADDGSFAVRFSDLAIPSPHWPMAYRAWRLNTASDDGRVAQIPTRYEAQFDLPPGGYDLQIVVSDGTDFGQAEMPLGIEKYDKKKLALSSVMLCKRYRDAHVAAVERAAANLAPQYVPLVSKGVEFTPTAETRFRKGEPLIAYFEIHEPLLEGQPAPAATGEAQTQPLAIPPAPSVNPAVSSVTPAPAGIQPPQGLAVPAQSGIPAPAGIQSATSGPNPAATLTVEAHFRILDAKTGKVIKDFPPLNAAPYEQPGSWKIPIAGSIPFEQLPKGEYRLEVQATDSAGRSTPWRTANFTVE